MNKLHFRRRHALSLEWKTLLFCEARGKLPKTPLTQARISLVRHSDRTLDFDGLVGSMKPVVDALVSCGVLFDDTWKITGAWEVNQVFRAKKLGPLLEIQITGV